MDYVKFDIKWNSVYLRDGVRSSEYFCFGGGYNDYLDCYDDSFYFTSILFPEEVAAGGVSKSALELDTNGKVKYIELLLHGALSMLCLDPSRPISILRNDRKINLAPIPFNLDFIYRKHFNDTEEVFAHALLALAVESYSRILLYFQKGNNWVEWYKVVETIIGEYPQYNQKNSSVTTPKELIVDANELKRFNYTANNPLVSGANARHGHNGQKASRSLQPMTIVEGHAFVNKLVIAYANEKIKQYKNWHP